MRRTIHSAGLTEADLAAVLLVGGSSRIPLVTELLSAGLGRPVAVDADPKATVAIGAALSASLDTVVEPVPAIVASNATTVTLMTVPPSRPSEPDIPLHLPLPARHHRVVRPKMFAGAAGLALVAMAGGALFYSAQTNDLGPAPAQAATPGGAPTVTQEPAVAGHGTSSHKPTKSTSHTSATTSTSKPSGATSTSQNQPAPPTTTTGNAPAGGPMLAPPPADPSSSQTPPTTDPSTSAGSPKVGPPPADPPTTTVSSAPADPTTASFSGTLTSDPAPTSTTV
jgi:molecular chaperone DnaK